MVLQFDHNVTFKFCDKCGKGYDSHAIFCRTKECNQRELTTLLTDRITIKKAKYFDKKGVLQDL